MTEGPYSLMAELEKVKGKDRPPIHLWNPEQVKDIDMRVQADGTWHYMGTPIERPRLVRLFSTVLRLEGNDYFLVTPVEKCRITVEDAPFQGVLLDIEGKDQNQLLTVTTNMGDAVALDAEHPLRVELDEATEVPALYVMVRDGLEARLNRNVYYQFTELLTEQRSDGESWMGVWSHDQFFKVMKSDRL